MDIRLWAISVNLTLAMVLNILLLIFICGQVPYTHRYSLYVDRLQDHLPTHCKSYSFFCPHSTMVLFFVDRLRLRNGSHTVILQPSSVRGVGSAPPTYVQRIQQARSYQEDKANRPWRPLPSGRISEPKAVVLRWTTVLLCVLLSFIYDQDLVSTTLCLVSVTYIYDER